MLSKAYEHLHVDANNGDLDVVATMLFGERGIPTWITAYHDTLQVRATAEMPDLISQGKPIAATKVLERHGMNVSGQCFEKERCSYITGFRGLGKNNGLRLASLLPAMAPWVFRDQPLTEEEKELLRLCATNHTEADRYIHEWRTTHQQTLRTIARQRQMTTFIEALSERRVADLRDQESYLLSRLAGLAEDYNKVNHDYQQIVATIRGTLAGYEDEDLTGFVNLVSSHPDIELDSIRGTELRLTLAGWADNFSEGKLTDLLGYNSELFSGIPVAPDVAKQCYQELFFGTRFKVKLFGAFSFDFGGGGVNLYRNSGSEAFPGAIPNPHIYYFACAGGFAALHREAMRKGDYMEALEIAFSEVRNINFGDYSPVCRFVADLWKGGHHVWDDAQQRWITMQELVNILEDREA